MAVGEGGHIFAGDGSVAGSKSSSVTAIPLTSQANSTMEKLQESGNDDFVPTQASSISDREPSLEISRAGTRDDQWTSSDEKEEEEDNVRHTKSRDLRRTSTNMSIADTLSLPREIMFVMVICFAQLFTRTVTPFSFPFQFRYLLLRS